MPKIETPRDEKPVVEGNTILQPAPVKQGNQLVKWFFTYNHYKKEDIEIIETKFKEICDKYVFQEEIGDKNGIPHLQGSIVLKKKMRWTEFDLMPQIHWEKTKNEDSADNYCAKARTRAGKVYTNFAIPEEVEKLDTITELRPWQKELIKKFALPATSREVTWVYDKVGNVGKSAFCIYLYDTMKSVLFIDGVKKADLINGIVEYRGKIGHNTIVLLDIPRHARNHVCYSAIESIKNGLVFNTKYETSARRFNSPHVLIFANEPPIINDLSFDRWRIYEIVDMELIRREIVEVTLPNGHGIGVHRLLEDGEEMPKLPRLIPPRIIFDYEDDYEGFDDEE